jgi:hypothetical protein
MNYYFFCIQLLKNNYKKIVEKDFIYYNIIAIKWGESTHFPGWNDPGRTGHRGETTRILIIDDRNCHGSGRTSHIQVIFFPNKFKFQSHLKNILIDCC